VREAVCTGEIIFAPVSTASRRALLFPGNNLRSADGSSQWSFKRPLDATLSAFLRNFFDMLNQSQGCKLFFLDAPNSRTELPQLRVHLFVAAIQMINAVHLRRAFSRESGNH
jgi:hypothetical protein